MIDHISERITSSYDISCDDITVDSYKEGEFLVNCRRSDVEYKVRVKFTARNLDRFYRLDASLLSSSIKSASVKAGFHSGK